MKGCSPRVRASQSLRLHQVHAALLDSRSSFSPKSHLEFPGCRSSPSCESRTPSAPTVGQRLNGSSYLRILGSSIWVRQKNCVCHECPYDKPLGFLKPDKFCADFLRTKPLYPTTGPTVSQNRRCRRSLRSRGPSRIRIVRVGRQTKREKLWQRRALRVEGPRLKAEVPAPRVYRVHCSEKSSPRVRCTHFQSRHSSCRINVSGVACLSVRHHGGTLLM